jgi:hypothetical protein
MTTLIAFSAGALIIVALAYIGWRAAYRAGAAKGKADATSDAVEKAAQSDRVAAEIIAEHRSVDDAADRLRDGSF